MTTRTEGSAGAPAAPRVLVALDTVSRHPELLEPAVTLAALLGAELDALFVEDETLLRAVGLRSSREVVLVSAAERETSPTQMSRALRRLAASLQAQVEAMAKRAGVMHRFEVVRGHRYLSVFEARASSDVVVTGRLDVAWSAHSRIRVLRLLFGTTDAAARALEVTIGMARRYRADVELVVPQAHRGTLHETIAALHERLRQQALFLRVRHCGDEACLELLAADPLAGRLVILPADFEGIASAEALREWIDALKCPLVLVK